MLAPVMRRPALVAAVLLALGIAAHPLLPSYPIAWLFIAISLVILAFRFRNRASFCTASIVLALVGSGVISGQLAS
jgi:hypothetical protein